METFKVNMKKERETKGAVLYKAVDKNGVFVETMHDVPIFNIYIRKTALNGEIPAAIAVTVRTA